MNKIAPITSPKKQLQANAEFYVRFSETDTLAVVWHGNYFKYFEDGREAFGHKYGLDFLAVYEQEGYITPIVQCSCDFKLPLKYGEKARVVTTMVASPAAKIIFDYCIYRLSDEKLTATGRTVQVFVDKTGDLSLNIPAFFETWKKKWGINPS